MNKKLEKLYEKYWYDLLNNSDGKKSAHPLLLKVKKEYQEADIKIMIVGQETDGWNGSLEKNKRSISYLMDDYYNYLYNISSNDKLVERLKKKNRRPFWNKKNFRFFQEKLKKEYQNKKVAFIWNNVSKIGKLNSGKQTQTIKKFEEQYFKDVFKKEIEILKPNILIFVTGDRKIPITHNHLKSIKDKQVSEVIFDDFPDIISIRTYHPNARIKGGKKHLKNQVIELITKKIQ